MSSPPTAVLCTDSLPWLEAMRGKLAAIVTSLPDAAEMGWEVDAWRGWYPDALEACLHALMPGGLAVFFQTDRREGGRWVSKAAPVVICTELAHDHSLPDLEVLWHKVVLRHEAATVDLFRPGYSHLIAVGRGLGPGKATPDVLAPSASLYPNGMPVAAARLAVHAVQAAGLASVCDPFCGRGTVLWAAREAGLAVQGLDIDEGQVQASLELLATTPDPLFAV